MKWGCIVGQRSKKGYCKGDYSEQGEKCQEWKCCYWSFDIVKENP